MQIRILLFGVLKDSVGTAETELELPQGATVAGVLAWLAGRLENADVLRSIAVAVNQEYSTANVALREGDEVALLPPVSGGAR